MRFRQSTKYDVTYLLNTLRHIYKIHFDKRPNYCPAAVYPKHAPDVIGLLVSGSENRK